MHRALISYAPLLACPLGMLAMAAIPALVHRARTRRQDSGAPRVAAASTHAGTPGRSVSTQRAA
jgi:hypothetical protein